MALTIGAVAEAFTLDRRAGVDFSATKLSQQLYETMVEMGCGDLDRSGLIKIFDAGSCSARVGWARPAHDPRQTLDGRPDYNARYIPRLGIEGLKPAFSYARRSAARLGSPPVPTVAMLMPASFFLSANL